MNRKFKTLAGGVAVAGLVIAGSVAASAVDAVKVEKVGYFEVQGDSDGADANNVAPTAWFSEKDDDIAGITIGADSVTFAASAKSVGLNKIVEIPFADADFAIDASGTARYSIAVESPKVDYMRLTAVDVDVDEDTEWYGTGFFKDGDRTPDPAVTLSMTLADWAAAPTLWGAEDILDGATITLIGARHFSGQGEGAVKSITANGTKYVFGTTAYDQADVDEAAAAAKAKFDGWKSPADYAAALAEVPADAKAEIDALKAKVAELEGDLAKAEKAAAKSENQALAAQARAPYRITGKAKTGNKLRVKGKSYKGVNVKYQWYVGGKKAGKKATLKLKKADARKKVRVVVSATYRNASNKKVTVKQNVKLTKVSRVSR